MSDRLLQITLLLFYVGVAISFQPVTTAAHASTNYVRLPTRPTAAPFHTLGVKSCCRTSTNLNMFMGSDGGILGIGTPELVTILLVGYFVLGPSDLYKIVKEVGKFIQNFRTLSSNLTTSFQSNMESQLQLEEVRKAQRELNDAFSFRRTINVDEDSDAFSTKPKVYSDTANYEEDVGSSKTATTTTPSMVSGNPTSVSSAESEPRRKIRRRLRKRSPETVNEVTDWEMPESKKQPVTFQSNDDNLTNTISVEEAAQIEAEFDKYTDLSSSSSNTKDRYGQLNLSSSESNSIDNEVSMEQSRFQQQLSGNWNQQILDNEGTLGSLTTVMNKIALLEKEKLAATRRLEEEFQKRKELEEKYYQEQRKLLDEAARTIQDTVIGVGSTSTTKV